MNKREVKKLYRCAVAKWGLDLQFGVLMEECAELIQATNKLLRKGTGDVDAVNHLAEEMADVEIMIEQLKTVYTWMDLSEKVVVAKEKKLNRLEKRLGEV